MHALYLLTFSSGKSYVGQTVRTMQARLQQHRAAARRGSDLPVHCAWRKYGEPVVKVLGEFETHEALHRAEIEAIARLGVLAPGGYNVGHGGETSPAKSPDVARKIAASAKGRKHADTSAWVEATTLQWQDPEYREKVMAGVQASLTDARRAQLSAASSAMWEKRRAEGWSMPEATKAKIRQRVFSPEAIAKMSESAKRRGIPPEQRSKMADAQRVLPRAPHSEERRKNMSAGIKAAWADPVKRERLMAARKVAGETRRRKQQEAKAP